MDESLETLFRELEEYAVNHRVPIIGQAGAVLLGEVVTKKQPLFVLEIGTAIGYSSILIAANAPNASVVTIEQDTERIKVAKQFIERAGYEERIEIMSGDAGQLIPRLSGPFDFVFIDAAKGQYLDYLAKVLDKLMPGSVIVADNVYFRGMVTGQTEIPRRYRTIVKRLKQYHDAVMTDPRFETTVYTNGDGLAITYYKGDFNV